MKYLLLILLAACTKHQPDCAQVYTISEKYKGGNLVKVDTLYSAYLCDRWLDTMRAQRDQWFTMCEQTYFDTEHLKTVIK